MSEEPTRFGRLTFTGISEVRGQGKKSRSYWLCRCDCGKLKWIYRHSLIKGATRSCGCFQQEVRGQSRISHGYTRNRTHPPEYGTWEAMRHRCNDPRHNRYSAYGGRGIKVCQLWQDSFEAFLKSVGPKPSRRHQLDRIDNNGNYEPGNVRWVTPKQNARNGRHNVVISIDGVTACLAEHCERLGIKKGSVGHLVRKYGRTHAEAIEIVRSRI